MKPQKDPQWGTNHSVQLRQASWVLHVGCLWTEQVSSWPVFEVVVWFISISLSNSVYTEELVLQESQASPIDKGVPGVDYG